MIVGNAEHDVDMGRIYGTTSSTKLQNPHDDVMSSNTQLQAPRFFCNTTSRGMLVFYIGYMVINKKYTRTQLHSSSTSTCSQ